MDLLSINNVAAKLGLSVHQLRRWELMFGLEIKRGRGQQRQYRPEDLSVLERIKELVEQGWPTSQVRPQLESEGLITPKLIGLPSQPNNTEVLMESLIGFRTFCERRFIDLSKQIEDLRHLVISMSVKQELQVEAERPVITWQTEDDEDLVPPIQPVSQPLPLPPQEILIGQVSTAMQTQTMPAGNPSTDNGKLNLPDITDQNYITILGKALDLVGWSDEEADQFCLNTFSIPHWDVLGRSQAEKLIEHLCGLASAGQL